MTNDTEELREDLAAARAQAATYRLAIVEALASLGENEDPDILVIGILSRAIDTKGGE